MTIIVQDKNVKPRDWETIENVRCVCTYDTDIWVRLEDGTYRTFPIGTWLGIVNC